MKQIKQARLIKHIQGLFQHVVLPEITPKGYILSVDEEGNVYPDRVATHHLVELCIEISPLITNDILNNAASWFFKSFNIQDPFAVTTIAETNNFNLKYKDDILNGAIASNQKPGGFIDLYAGFLDGGSIFSTLWGIKIVNHLDNKINSISKKAFEAIERNWVDVDRNSFKGFYCELKWKYGIHDLYTKKASMEILSSQNENGIWDNSPLYTAYILGNLCNAQKYRVPKLRASIEKGLETIFELDKDLNQMPAMFANAKEHYSDSAYLQLVLRSLISAIRYLKEFKRINLKDNISNVISGFFPLVYHSYRESNAELKKMNDQYGDIHSHFNHLDKLASKHILSESPYEKNVFIMMPFRQDEDERYENIENSIKNTLKDIGYKGWIASDIAIDNQLWNNVACYLLACKYGIAVFTRNEEDMKIEVRQFNPNVSLELGFFLSRGKDVLILKDDILPKLPTDLVGFLYKDFNFNRVSSEIPKKIKNWIKELESKNQKSK